MAWISHHVSIELASGSGSVRACSIMPRISSRDISTVCPRSPHDRHSLARTLKSPPYHERRGSTIEMRDCLSDCDESAVFFTFQFAVHLGHFMLIQL